MSHVAPFRDRNRPDRHEGGPIRAIVLLSAGMVGLLVGGAWVAAAATALAPIAFGLVTSARR